MMVEDLDIVSTSRETLEKFIRELCVLTKHMKILQVSGYPSDGIAANVSKDTTLKEVKEIAGIPLSKFRIQNINLMFGKVNSLEYASEMFNAPTLQQLEQLYLEEKKAS